MPRSKSRPALIVTRDDDGGLTIRDPQSDLVLSIIATHPDASGPRGVTLEVYDYRGRDVLASNITPPKPGEEYAPVPLTIAHHPTFAFYGEGDR